jgi:hypothetical protein
MLLADIDMFTPTIAIRQPTVSHDTLADPLSMMLLYRYSSKLEDSDCCVDNADRVDNAGNNIGDVVNNVVHRALPVHISEPDMVMLARALLCNNS